MVTESTNMAQPDILYGPCFHSQWEYWCYTGL